MNIKLNLLADSLFNEDAPHYRLQYDKLIAERDTSDVWRQFAIWLLVDPDHGVIRFTKPDSERYQAIKHVAYLYSTHCKDRELLRYTTAAAEAAAKIDYTVDYNDPAATAAARTAYYASLATDTSAWAAMAYALICRDPDTEAAKYAAGAAAAAYSADAARAAKAAAVARAAKATKAAAVARAAYAATSTAAYKHMADKLLELLQLAPPKENV